MRLHVVIMYIYTCIHKASRHIEERRFKFMPMYACSQHTHKKCRKTHGEKRLHLSSHIGMYSYMLIHTQMQEDARGEEASP
jgi:hypothetical protein